MKKAYGFPTTKQDYSFLGGLICGSCFDEDGKFLGNWTSSDIDWLKTDLKNHAEGYEYIFNNTPPEFLIELIRNK